MIDSLVFILIQGTNHQQLEVGRSQAQGKQKEVLQITRGWEVEHRNVWVQGLTWVQGWVGQVHRNV